MKDNGSMTKLISITTDSAPLVSEDDKKIKSKVSSVTKIVQKGKAAAVPEG